jgi:hypothetical protein
MFQRIVRVFKLDASVFEEVEHDHRATGQAALIVLIAGILSGLNGALLAIFNDNAVLGTLLGSIIWSLAGWFIWAAIAFVVGKYIFKGVADMGEMLRTMGFAFAPLWLSIIPCLGPLVGALWALSAGFIAIRQGLDLNNTKAVATTAIGFGVYIIGAILVGSLGLLPR